MRLALFVLELCDFFDALLVAAAAERGIEPGIDNGKRRGSVHDPSAKGQHIGVIVFAAELCGFGGRDVCGAHAVDLVGSDGHSNTGAAHQDAEISLARGDFFANAARKVRVVDALVGASAAVIHFDALFSQVLLHAFFQLKTCMVRAYRDLHERLFTT